MKKLILGVALACFVAFGAMSVQLATASAENIEIVNLQFDDDPDKNKKAEAKSDGKDKKCKTPCDKSKVECKDKKAKSASEAKCCPSKTASKECKKGDGDKK